MVTGSGPANGLAFGDFVIDPADERVIGPFGPVRLGHKAYQVLLALAQQGGRLLTKDSLFSTVWDGTIVSESALTSTIKELRRALGDESRTPTYIESVYGRGYRLIPAVHAVGANVAAPVRSASSPVKSRPAGRPPLILVSRFDDSAIQTRDPYCAAGLREEVLSGLARFREIQLVADDRPEGEADEGRRSERGYQLTARFLPDGEGVKAVIRAKRLDDGIVLWAETISLADYGTAGGVERIVRRIVGAALPAVDDDVLAGLPRDSGDLYDRYLIAKRRSLFTTSFAEAKAAAVALETIRAEAPDFALVYPPLVRLYNIDFGYTGLGSTGPAQRALALDLAKAGLAADRSNVHAYTVLGFCHLWHGEVGAARNCFDHALAVNPYNHVRLQECAAAWMYMGNFATAHELMARAAELNPLHDDAFYEDHGRLLLIGGEYEESFADLQSVALPSVLADLYRSVCAVRLGVARHREMVSAWRSRVTAHWHDGGRPTKEDLLAWVSFHHPLHGESRERFLSDVAFALDATAEPALIAVVPRPE